MLWTRLVGSLPDTVDVVWDVAADPDFSVVIATGAATASVDHGHSVHVIAAGLPAGATWWYRFRAGDQTSPTGRTRTMPAIGDPRPLRIGASSCQLRETGFWAAHRDLAEADLDLFVWLGDYIYEGGGSENGLGRAHAGGTVDTLDGYRARYAEYRADPVLQAAHQAHPWFATWDDHEVENDHDATVDPARRAAAHRAWWEFLPVRMAPPEPGAPLTVYRSLDLGDRLRVVVTDDRQYATADTLLGEPQKVWLAEQLADGPTWTLLGSPVLASGLYTGDDVLLPYTFDGHPEERKWLGDQLATRAGRVIVSGDLHAATVFEFSPDRRDVDSPVVATEFMAPAISSAFPERYADAAALLPLFNSHMKLFDRRNGWLLLTFDRTELTADFRLVADVTDPDSIVTSEHRFVVTLGDPVPVELQD